MKKKSFICISLLFIFLCLKYYDVSAKTFKDQQVYENYAKIISANHIENEVVIKLKIEDKVYTGKFSQQISYEDYLFFHHNEGIIINVTFYFQNQQLIILKWFI